MVARLSLDDAPFILQLLNEPTFIENIGDKGVRELDDARRYLQEGPLADYERLGFGMCRVTLAEEGVSIGVAGLLKRDYLDDVDLGYAFLPEFCGHGYALEAAAAMMAYAREERGIRHVVAIVNDNNERSIRLLEKLAFERIGTVRPPGASRDVRLYRHAV